MNFGLQDLLSYLKSIIKYLEEQYPVWRKSCIFFILWIAFQKIFQNLSGFQIIIFFNIHIRQLCRIIQIIRRNLYQICIFFLAVSLSVFSKSPLLIDEVLHCLVFPSLYLNNLPPFPYGLYKNKKLQGYNKLCTSYRLYQQD